MTDPKPQPPEESGTAFKDWPAEEARLLKEIRKAGEGAYSEPGEPVPAPEKKSGARCDDCGQPAARAFYDGDVEMEVWVCWRHLPGDLARADGFAEGLQQGKREGLEQAARELEDNWDTHITPQALAAIRSLQTPAEPK